MINFTQSLNIYYNYIINREESKILESKATKKIIEWCQRYNSISEEKRPIIEYGIEVLVETLVKFLIFFVLGVSLQRIYETALILIAFCILRLFAGGIHFRSNLGCTGAALVIWGIALVGNEHLYLSKTIIIFSYSVSLILLFYFAPGDGEENKITFPKSRLINKIVSMIYISLLYCLVMFLNRKSIALIIFPITIECISIIPIWKSLRLIKRKKENK